MIRNKILRKEGIVYSGMWEPIYFQKQVGNNFDNIESSYSYQRSEKHVKHLARSGVNQVWPNFFKGYGNVFEGEEQERTGRFIRLCHKYKIRVIPYITFGTLALDFLTNEIPDCRHWGVRTDLGEERASYSFQSFRTRVDFTCTERNNYLIKVVDRALDMGADGIHFDNAEWAIGNEQCRCERCTSEFRKWLTVRYGDSTAATRKAGMARYGANDFSSVEPPWFNLQLHIVQQRQVRHAVQQDWIQFRCDAMAKAARQLAAHIRKRGALVEFNFGKNDNCNNAYYRGLDLERLYPICDMSFHESMDKIGFNAHGTPISAIRNFTIARSFGTPLLCYCSDTLEQAEAFAFNSACVGRSGVGRDGDVGSDRKRQEFVDFFNKYRAYNLEAEPIAGVAILRHRLSMAFDTYRPYLDASAVEQTLQENQIPFGILGATQLGKLNRYNLLVIPSMRYMTDDEGDRISKWVRRGGRLLLIGSVGTINELNQTRTWVKNVKSERDLNRSRIPRCVFSSLTKQDFTQPFTVKAGKGTVAWMPELEHVDVPGTTPADWTVERNHVNMPKNSRELLNSVLQLLGDDRRIKVYGPNDLLVQFSRRADTGEAVIQLVNVGHAEGRTADATVCFRWPRKLTTGRELRYDEKPRKLPVNRDAGWYTVVVEGIREHAVLIIK